jgi:hypothetical protein
MADDAEPLIVRRRKILQLLAGTAAAGAIPAIASAHPILRHLTNEPQTARAQANAARPEWKPQFLDQHQFETLQSFAERVIPGASRAHTSEFIDQLLAVDSPDVQRKFLGAIGAFEGQALRRGRRPWKALPEAEQTAILTEASAMASGTLPEKPWAPGEPILPPTDSTVAPPMTLRDHFDLLKGWIAGAYYSSEIGMKELGSTGNMFFESFPGCSHPDAHA